MSYHFDSLSKALLWRCKDDFLKVIINILDYFLILIAILVNVAFITLLERKILGYSQLRLGPNKVSVFGILQPFADAIKLFIKQITWLRRRNKVLYLISPGLAFLVALWYWTLIPNEVVSHMFKYSFLVLITVIAYGVYPLLLRGWASNRNYASLGSLRGVAQRISYEISLALLILLIIFYYSRFSFRRINYVSTAKPMILIFPLLIILLALTFLAETNRTPFDFAEGESELVSGFNTEYSAISFVLIFLAEYASIYFLRYFLVIFLINFNYFLIASFLATLWVFFWVWARCTLPRYRYDLLITLCWKILLPTTLALDFLFLAFTF